MKRRTCLILAILCTFIVFFESMTIPAFAYSTGDDYPNKNSCAGCHSTYYGDDHNDYNSRAFYYRQCTDFVAWCLISRNGVEGFCNSYGGYKETPEGNKWGNAYNWEYAAASLDGCRVDNTPAVGAVAVWRRGAWIEVPGTTNGGWPAGYGTGHVAWVKEVNGDRITIEEYNNKVSGGFDSITISASNPSCYLHIKDLEPPVPTAPKVYASPVGTEVDISWNDVGASSYYIYVQNKDDQSIPYGNNVGRTFSIHLGLSAGNFNAYVTAVYSSDNMKTGSAEFTTSPLMAAVNKGAESNYDLNEPVIISVNADPNAVDSCVLKIYRTPTGGDTYLYWEGQVFSSQYTAIFSAEGHYSCCYLFSKNDHTIESGWVGWNIIENNLCATVDKGQDGIYALNEPVLIGINADVNTVESCVLKIYRTPTDGETYLYWEGQLFSSQNKIQFSKEGYYSCCFILTHNNLYLESGWVGWIVKEPFTLPINLKSIEDEAFAGIRNCVIRVPDGVTTISPTAFDSSVTLIVKSGTEAAEAVKDLELNVITE